MEAQQPPDRDWLLELYKIALDEYRFQVNLNWKRTEHWFTLNTAIAGAAITLLHFAKEAAFLLVAGIFFVGALASLVAIAGVLTQHGYYREARDHKGRIEAELQLGERTVATTPGMKEKQGRPIKLHLLYAGLLFVLALLDLGGAAYAVAQY